MNTALAILGFMILGPVALSACIWFLCFLVGATVAVARGIGEWKRRRALRRVIKARLAQGAPYNRLERRSGIANLIVSVG